MPPFKLKVRCDGCIWKRTGWYPGILMKADKHAGDRYHTLSVSRMDGRHYCTIKPPVPEETW